MMELILLNGCKVGENLKRLDMSKLKINLKSIFYEEKEMRNIMKNSVY